MKRKRLLLLILLLILALAWWSAYHNLPRQRHAASPATAPAVKEREAAAAGETPHDLAIQLELLDKKGEPFPGYRRNIFGSIQPPPPPPPPRPKPKPKTPPPAPPRPSVPQPVEQAPAPVQQALARFTFLGYLEQQGQKTVFLQQEQEIFVVRNGSRFGPNEEFQVVQLTPTELIIQQGGDERPITVPLVEKKSLAPKFGPAAEPPEPGRRSLPAAARPTGRRPPPPSVVAPARDRESPDAGSTPPTAVPNEVMQ